jgi:LacI family transcriptional regulator
MTKRVTVYDIAKECGISASTISRVLNDSIMVRDERKKLVLDTARRLGYQKRTIRKQESRAILNIKLFLPVTRNTFVHMFYDVAELVDGIHQGFGDVKVNIIVRLNRGENEAFANYKLKDIHGCIFAFTEPYDRLMSQIEERKISALMLNRERQGLNFVKYDEEACMTELLEQIIEKRGNARSERIQPCFIGFTQVPYINSGRKDGLARGCRRYGLDFDVHRDVFDFNSVKDIPGDFLKQLHEKGYNTIMCFNDLVAMSIYQSAIATGYSFPRDFSLTGFDDSPAQELLPQRIDTIRFNVEHLGREAGQWLKKQIIDRMDVRIEKNLVGEYVEGKTI